MGSYAAANPDDFQKLTAAVIDQTSGKNEPLEVHTMLDPNFEAPPKNYLVDGLLEPGDAVLLAGMWGAGKSNLALALSTAVMDPDENTFLGRSVMQHGPVLYLDQENSLVQLRSRVQLLMAGRPLPSPEMFVASTARPLSLSNTRERAGIMGLVDQYNPVLVVLDSYVAFLGGADENGAGEMRRVFNEGVRPMADTGAAVLILDHTTKSWTGKEHPNIAARGSGDKGAASDRIWTLAEVDPYERLLKLRFGRSRNDRFVPDIGLQEHWSDDKLYYTVEDVPDDGPDFRPLVDALLERDGCADKGELAVLVAKSRSAGLRLIDRAEKAGVVRFEPHPEHRQKTLVLLEPELAMAV